MITASATSPLEFAREAFATLGVYAEAALAAWYQLHNTGDPKYFAALVKSRKAEHA
jgi:hypothetical protein